MYDRHAIAALRRAGIAVHVVRADREAVPRCGVAIVDSIAFGRASRVRADRLIALAHMPTASRAVLRRADRVVAVSRALAHQIGRRDTVVIPPGCDAVARLATRRRSSTELRVLCVANASFVKGTDVLAAAAAMTSAIRIDHVGERPRLRKRTTLVPHGTLRGTALARRYRDADVAVVPSRSEGYGIAAAEAIALGRPVIASDLPSLRAIVGDAGLLIPPSDVHALARALTRMKEPALRRRLARRARSRAKRLPTWRDTERAFLSLVEAELQRSVTGGDEMPPRGVKSPKRKRQYEHIKRSEMRRGRSSRTAKRIAAATTNKTRRRKGETKKG